MSLEKVSSRDGTLIAIERTGQGKPLLVIHGTASSRQRWFLTAAALGEGRELILMDRRGRGDSTDATSYSIEHEFDDVASVVSHIGKPLDILAHSYGAMITLGAAPRLPRVDNIILYEPPLDPLPPDSDLPDRIEACVKRGDLEGGLRLFLTQVGVSEAEVAKLRELPNWPQRLTIVPTIPREMRAARNLSFSPEHLGKISTRILLQLGSDSPPRFGTAINALAKTLPNARVEILPGQKHQAMDTAPALFVKSVRAFFGDAPGRWLRHSAPPNKQIKDREKKMAAPSPKEDILEPELPICDPHHHLWDFPNSRYFLPELLADVQSGHNVQSTVFVECTSFYRASGPEELRVVGETEFVNGVAAMAASGRYGPVLACEGIVSRADLTLGEAVGPVLDAHIRAGNGRFRGIRHAGAWDASPDIRKSHTNPPQGLYGQANFRLGLKELAKRNLSFEAWQYHPQLPDVIALARAVPEAKIVLNHVGGPVGLGPYAGRREEIFATWSRDIKELATCPNVFVKLGGLGMPVCGFNFHKREVLPGSQELADAWRPYLETCITAFGPQRGMLESNFPVDGASCSYAALWNAFKRVTKGASAHEKELLYRKTARTFYRLDV